MSVTAGSAVRRDGRIECCCDESGPAAEAAASQFWAPTSSGPQGGSDEISVLLHMMKCLLKCVGKTLTELTRPNWGGGMYMDCGWMSLILQSGPS